MEIDPSELNGKVVVYYGRESCPYCRDIVPFLHQLAAQYPNVSFKYYDTARNSFEGGVPHFEFYHNARKLGEVTGADDRAIQSYVISLTRQ